MRYVAESRILSYAACDNRCVRYPAVSGRVPVQRRVTARFRIRIQSGDIRTLPVPRVLNEVSEFVVAVLHWISGIVSKITRSRREIFNCQNVRLRGSGAYCYLAIAKFVFVLSHNSSSELKFTIQSMSIASPFRIQAITPAP